MIYLISKKVGWIQWSFFNGNDEVILKYVEVYYPNECCLYSVGCGLIANEDMHEDYKDK